LAARYDAWKTDYARFDAARLVNKRYQEMVELGKTVRAKVDAFDIEAARIALTNALGNSENLKRELRDHLCEEKKLIGLVRDGFDGQCPVSKEPCPVPASVSVCLQSTKNKLESERELIGNVRASLESIPVAHLTKEISEYESNLQQLKRLRESVKALKVEGCDDPGEGPPPPVENPRLKEIYARIGQIDTLLSIRVEFLAAKVEATESRALVQKWRKVRAIFGKNGAQRQVAESVLSSIQARANELLLQAGIRLSLEITWAREGKGLALDCEACGHHFGSKGGIVCEKCGQARAPKLIQKLEVELSNRSGALEDLAGIAIQIAASEWLRNVRGSEWGSLMLDEPFASLDKGNRQAMSAHIIRLLGSFEQAFVIAHTPDTTMAMPHRIEIEAHDNGSYVKVVQ
jgi:DNA repair exonuclease SbcCD ATPase subunit